MATQAQFDAIVADFQARELPSPTPRRARLPAIPGKVDAVVGMRRSGKTWLLFQHLRGLLEAGTPREQTLYVNFEDERLLPLAADDLQRIPEAHFRRFPSSRERECWFLFDEIQNVPGWERFIRRLVDEPRVRLAVTGSSAKHLSREIATSLRGRSLTTELLPFGFDEALAWSGLAVPERWPPPAVERSRLQHALGRYLEIGGFPEVQGLPPPARLRLLQDYVDVVLFRDVVERHGVTNVAALRWLVRRLVGSPAGRFTVNRFHNDLKSQGFRVAKDSVYEYVAHLEDPFLMFTVPIWTESERVRMSNPRKCYLIDHGLARASSFKAERDTGHLLENVVYLELRRRGFEMAYVQTPSGHEVDFLARHVDGRALLVQVCADPSEAETRDRELRALAEALDAHDAEALVVTLDAEETVALGRREVRFVPAWRWLLEEVATRAPGG